MTVQFQDSELEDWEDLLMKTINLTDDQFETLFHFVDERVEDIVDRLSSISRFRNLRRLGRFI